MHRNTAVHMAGCGSLIPCSQRLAVGTEQAITAEMSRAVMSVPRTASCSFSLNVTMSPAAYRPG